MTTVQIKQEMIQRIVIVGLHPLKIDVFVLQELDMKKLVMDKIFF
jgi:hypothetical protein